MVTELNMWDCNFSSVNHSLTWWESWTALKIKLSSSLHSLPFLLLLFLPHQFPQQFLETPLLLQLLFLPLLHHPLWLLQILPSHLWKARRNISHILHCFRLVPNPNSTEASIPAPPSPSIWMTANLNIMGLATDFCMVAATYLGLTKLYSPFTLNFRGSETFYRSFRNQSWKIVINCRLAALNLIQRFEFKKESCYYPPIGSQL